MKINSILSLMVLLYISMASFTAFAQEGCPDGLSLSVAKDNGGTVCVLNEQPNPAVKSSNEVAEQPALSDDEKIAIIRQSVRKGGWGIMLGLGFGLNEKVVKDVAAFNIKARAGFQYPSPILLSFGLYIDFNLRPGTDPLFTMDMTIDPTMHISFGRTRLSLALGFGAFVSKSTSDVFGEKLETKVYHNAFFEFKPAFLVDWFITENAFWGLNFEFPVLLLHDYSPNVWISFNMHIGYRF